MAPEQAPDPESPRSNPRRLFHSSALFRVHYGYYMARDAEGRIYVGCHAERQRVGGALVVYDPRTGEKGGVGEPELTNYDVAGLAATPDGKSIIYSSRVVRDPVHPDATPAEAKLFVHDPHGGRFVRTLVPLPGRQSLGVLAPGAPGQVVGVSPVPQGHGSTLYAVEIATGKVLYQRPLSEPVGGAFRPGPDGQIWTFLGSVLVRIRPETGEVTPLGTVASGPGDLLFVGKHLYLAGTTSLRRIRGVL